MTLDNEIDNGSATAKDSLTTATGEIVLYQPDETIRLEVRLEDDTVWLTQAQMAILFGRDRSVIGKHINNCFREGELNADVVCANFAHTTIHGAIEGKMQVHSVTFYNLDVIISVGYRVKSVNGTKFRQWATGVLKKYNNYIDDTVLTLLDKRTDGVNATIYTRNVSQQLLLDLQRHNAQYAPITIENFNRAHDRFLLIDDEVYHIGASLKDLGKKWFAFTKMNDLTATELTNRI
jgi:hypothetical protein